jgi:anaerobic selenocysteine-containing dehydrogenase
MRATRVEVKTTCPRDCYDGCGVSVVLEGGRIRSVKGDPDHFVSRGSLCGKCSIAYNGAWIDPQQRLAHPQKRVGRKGLGQLVTIGWDEALGEIAERLRETAVDRAHTILHTHYTGTCSVIAGNFPMRFFRRLGATEVDPDTVCNKAGHQALAYTIGTSFVGFDPRQVADADCILIWGANPHACAPHVHKHWLPEASAAKVVIDPIAHPTAREADLFLQPRPGTDAALAFAMLHAIVQDGLVDEEFVAAHVLGWDDIRPAVESVTPRRGESLTGVPAGLIVEAALLYGRGPSLLWLGQGMQRQRMGGNGFRAAAALCAATGNIGRPGTGLLYLNGPATRAVDLDYVTAPHLSRGKPRTISHMDLADTLADPAKSAALFCWNNNIVASSPSQTALRQALRREDLLHVVIDLFQTDTADYADYVLPAASFLEFDDLVLPYFHNAVSAQVKVVEPPGDALPNQEIFRRLAQRMGFMEPELLQPDSSIMAKLLAQSGCGLDFAALAQRGTVLPDACVTPFADLVFPTPSGKIEIASERAAADGHPRVPLPHADQRSPDGRLRILSPASEWTMNSSYANDRKIKRRLADAPAYIHPREAARRHLADGEHAVLVNETGRLPVLVRLSEQVPEGVALVHKGRWPKSDPSGANVNVLNPGAKSDMGESSCVHAVEAELQPRRNAADGSLL